MSRRKAGSLGTEGLTADGPRRLEPVMIQVAEGPSKGLKLKFEQGTLSVGGEGCDLLLDDSAVSRRHLTLELLPGAVRVRDAGSRNGTFYLGARIEEALVPVGGTVRLGRSTLLFALLSQPLAPSERRELHGLIGTSVAMRQLFALLERLGPADSTVLIRGETGTGKDLVARVLHALSPRASKALVVVDCGAVHKQLVESELFGHVKGAFTGADQNRVGAVEAAEGGTLLLDEIGELPLELQPKLLRLLENREYRRVGDGAVRHADLRILAATHRDLDAHVKKGAFRADLLFRLAVAEVAVPPLRERREDIGLLARHFARQLTGVDVTLAGSTLASLHCEAWPGNVRELRNAVERAVLFGGPDPTGAPERSPSSYKEARGKLLDAFERDYLQSLIDRHRGNMSAAAREAGLSRSQFYRLLGRHGLG